MMMLNFGIKIVPFIEVAYQTLVASLLVKFRDEITNLIPNIGKNVSDFGIILY